MKTKVIVLFLGLASLSTFAQKKEVKAAEKAIKKEDFDAAINQLKAAESLIANADAKTKSKFYFLKGQAYMRKKDFKTAATSLQKLLDFEKKSGTERYSEVAKPMLREIVAQISIEASSLYENKDYKKASENFYLTYKLSPVDTTFIYNAAISATLAKEYDQALSYYKELQDLGYTGITTTYFATNKATGVKDNLGNKSSRDILIKAGTYKDPVDEITSSKVGDITKNIAYILKEQGKVEEAMIAVQKARKTFPKDLNLILTEAELYIKLERMDKFGELMKLAVEQDPTNPILFFNLGIVNQQQQNEAEAKKYYKKAIELKADYGDAYMNLAVVILEKEKEIIEEMNNSLSDFDKYDKLKEQQKAVYREALLYLEKADEYDRNLSTVKTLMNIYESLAMEDKAKEFRNLYKKLKDN